MRLKDLEFQPDCVYKIYVYNNNLCAGLNNNRNIIYSVNSKEVHAATRQNNLDKKIIFKRQIILSV